MLLNMHAKFFPLVQWSAEDASRSDPEFLLRIIQKVIEAGATTINLPDTVGYATPTEYGAIFKYMTENVQGIENVKLSAHCHNDLRNGDCELDGSNRKWCKPSGRNNQRHR